MHCRSHAGPRNIGVVIGPVGAIARQAPIDLGRAVFARDRTILGLAILRRLPADRAVAGENSFACGQRPGGAHCTATRSSTLGEIKWVFSGCATGSDRPVSHPCFSRIVPVLLDGHAHGG